VANLLKDIYYDHATLMKKMQRYCTQNGIPIEGKKTHHVYILKDNSDHLVGACHFYFKEKKLHIEDLAITSSSQRQGLGSLLLISIVGIAKDHLCRRITLNALDKSTAFFIKHHFKPIRITDHLKWEKLSLEAKIYMILYDDDRFRTIYLDLEDPIVLDKINLSFDQLQSPKSIPSNPTYTTISPFKKISLPDDIFDVPSPFNWDNLQVVYLKEGDEVDQEILKQLKEDEDDPTLIEKTLKNSGCLLHNGHELHQIRFLYDCATHSMIGAFYSVTSQGCMNIRSKAFADKLEKSMRLEYYFLLLKDAICRARLDGCDKVMIVSGDDYGGLLFLAARLGFKPSTFSCLDALWQTLSIREKTRIMKLMIDPIELNLNSKDSSQDSFINTHLKDLPHFPSTEVTGEMVDKHFWTIDGLENCIHDPCTVNFEGFNQIEDFKRLRFLPNWPSRIDGYKLIWHTFNKRVNRIKTYDEESRVLLFANLYHSLITIESDTTYTPQTSQDIKLIIEQILNMINPRSFNTKVQFQFLAHLKKIKKTHLEPFLHKLALNYGVKDYEGLKGIMLEIDQVLNVIDHS
jgi:N-acetylglutamate synthase-like GNAT family acetyltransferase